MTTTTGKWIAVHDGLGVVVYADRPSGHRDAVADVVSSSPEADGRLIAASKELLKALKNLVSLAKDHVADAEDWHDYQYAVRVIAKTEGNIE